MSYVLEVCADSVASVMEAQRGGATRIELCSNLIIGGTTPGRAFYQQVRQYSDLPVRILLRPRFGDFCYNDYEFQMMAEDVQMFRELGADGIVMGILRPDGSLNLEQLQTLKKAADTLDTTLHRAFDVCRDPYEALEQTISLGFNTILTSGQQNSAWNGRKLLASLQDKANGRIEILAGAGIQAETIEKLIPGTHITSYHMSGKIVTDSRMTFRREGVPMGLPGFSEFDIWQTSEEEVRKAVYTLQRFSSLQTS